jgi:hypothetical protein
MDARSPDDGSDVVVCGRPSGPCVEPAPEARDQVVQIDELLGAGGTAPDGYGSGLEAVAGLGRREEDALRRGQRPRTPGPPRLENADRADDRGRRDVQETSALGAVGG